MPEYRVTGTYSWTVFQSTDFNKTVTANNDDEAYDLISDWASNEVDKVDGDFEDLDVDEIVCLTPPAPATARERLVITRPDGTSYTCYGIYADVVAVTAPEVSGVQATRETAPIALPDGRTYHPYGAVERA